MQSRTGEHALETDVAEFAREKFEQPDLRETAGREVGVATLGGDRLPAVVRRDEGALAEPGARSDNRDGCGGAMAFARLQDGELLVVKMEHAEGGSFEVVDEAGGSTPEGGCDGLLAHFPGNVGGVADVVYDGTGDAEAGSVDGAGVFEKASEGGFEIGELVGDEDVIAQEGHILTCDLEEPEMSFGSADVAGNHDCWHRISSRR